MTVPRVALGTAAYMSPRAGARRDCRPVLLWQPVANVWLHSTGDASPPVSVRRQTFATGC